MDNGQSGGNAKKVGIFSSSASEAPEGQAFFTPGVGNEPPENNNIEPEINLDEENWQKALDISTLVGMPTPEQVAPKAENQAESPTDTANTSTELASDAPKDPATLGQITSIASPNPSQDTVKPYNPANIKTSGDYLDKNSLAEIERIKEKLNQDGDLNSFYDHTRDLTEVNLNNSFSRKLYQDGGEQ